MQEEENRGENLLTTLLTCSLYVSVICPLILYGAQWVCLKNNISAPISICVILISIIVSIISIFITFHLSKFIGFPEQGLFVTLRNILLCLMLPFMIISIMVLANSSICNSFSGWLSISISQLNYIAKILLIE